MWSLENLNFYKLSLSFCRLDLLLGEVSQTARAKDHLQLLAQQLAMDLKQMQLRLDTQAVESTAAVKDMRSKTDKLEQENKQTVQYLLLSLSSSPSLSS